LVNAHRVVCFFTLDDKERNIITCSTLDFGLMTRFTVMILDLTET